MYANDGLDASEVSPASRWSVGEKRLDFLTKQHSGSLIPCPPCNPQDDLGRLARAGR